MKQLIDLFNKKYGKELGVIDDSLTTENIYKILKIIKKVAGNDAEIMEILNTVQVPEPHTTNEILAKIDLSLDSVEKQGSNNSIEQCFNFNINKSGNICRITINDIEMVNKYVIYGGKIHIIGHYDTTFGNLTCELSSIITKEFATQDAYDEQYYIIKKFTSIKYSTSMLLSITLEIYNDNLSSINIALEAYGTNGNSSNEADMLIIDAIYFESLPNITIGNR